MAFVTLSFMALGREPDDGCLALKSCPPRKLFAEEDDGMTSFHLQRFLARCRHGDNGEDVRGECVLKVVIKKKKKVSDTDS